MRVRRLAISFVCLLLAAGRGGAEIRTEPPDGRWSLEMSLMLPDLERSPRDWESCRLALDSDGRVAVSPGEFVTFLPEAHALTAYRHAIKTFNAFTFEPRVRGKGPGTEIQLELSVAERKLKCSFERVLDGARPPGDLPALLALLAGYLPESRLKYFRRLALTKAPAPIPEAERQYAECRAHQVRMQPKRVPCYPDILVTYLPQYLEARNKLFPNSNMEVYGYPSRDSQTLLCLVCEKCVEAERRWQKREKKFDLRAVTFIPLEGQEIPDDLRKQVSADFKGTPLIDVVAFLSNLTGIHILVDPRSCEGDGPVVTLRVEEVSVRGILDRVCARARLIYTVRGEVIFITTKKELDRLAPLWRERDKRLPVSLTQGARKLLAAELSLNLVDTPIQDAVSLLSKLTKGKVVLDEASLGDDRRLVTLRANGLALSGVLDFVAHSAGLDYAFHRGRFHISTTEGIKKFIADQE